MSAVALDLEDEIYECALLPENWPALLDKLAGIAGARGGCFLAGSALTLEHFTASAAIETVVSDSVASGAINRTLRLAYVLEAGKSGFIREGGTIDFDSMSGDPLYSDHLWPSGLGYATGTAFRVPTGENVIISLERERAKGPVESEAVDRLDALRPHIARAAYLAARQQMMRAKHTVDLLAQLRLPAIVFSQAAKVLVANELVEGLSDHVVWRSADRIALRDRNADPLLQAAIATVDGDDPSPVRSFILRGADASGAMVAHVLPVRGSARDLFARSLAILILTPVTMPAGPPIELIQSLFDLTPSEASVARKIAGGGTVDEIASVNGVTANTIRTQLKSVLAKTGCRRQAEVASLLTHLASRVRTDDGGQA